MGATGTAILLTVIITIFNYEVKMEKCRCFIWSKQLKNYGYRSLQFQLSWPIAKVMTYGGLTVAIGQGIAKAGAIFPLSILPGLIR
ncbi:L-lactate permease [Staphylococcus aureus]